MKVAVIGGGAAGFFAAIQIASSVKAEVFIIEKTSKFLSKVKVSGGGRCNVTHHCFQPRQLSENYPRGSRLLKNLFQQFQAQDTVKWFESKGVKLKTEADGRMFPVTDSSQTIIDCFFREADRLNIGLLPNCAVMHIRKENNTFNLHTSDGKIVKADKVLIAIGGHANPGAYQFIAELGHGIKKPIPSLFTFNDPSKSYAHLAGVSVAEAEVKIAGTKFSQKGPLLITHWGLSGPAVIKLSAWSAEYLHSVGYKFNVLVNWTKTEGEESARASLLAFKEKNRLKKVVLHPLFDVPVRLWEHHCAVAGIPVHQIWAEMPHKLLNKLLEQLIRCPFSIEGKTTFKEEFVTCGGVGLTEINHETMESKHVAGLYFAGETLDIDGITGGFNFQAAWTTAWVAAQAIAQSTSPISS